MPPEDPLYLSRQLITCLGNKRALLAPVGAALARARARLGKEKLVLFDAFAGSGVVSRFFKAHAERLVSNDLEEYAAAAGRCFLRNRSTVDLAALADLVADLNGRVEEQPPGGFFAELYAPADDDAIRPGERVFYTRSNARRLDAYCRMLAQLPPDTRELLTGPLLSAASVHANTAGVFKGFYKDRATGVGRFGGSGGDALRRIRGRIELAVPLLSRFECPCEVLCADANALAPTLRGLDVAYLDPPYNQHPYGSNYFMLNLVARPERPAAVSAVSGIPADWKRSGYNARAKALPLLRELVASLDAPIVLVASSDEGFVPPAAMRAMLAEFGRVDGVATPHASFRGSRVPRRPPRPVSEQLFLLEKG